MLIRNPDETADQRGLLSMAFAPVRGRYVYGDVCSGALWSARLRRGRLVDDRPLHAHAPYLVSFGEDGRHRLYAVELNGFVELIDRNGA